MTDQSIELSIVIPCLNEIETLEVCLHKSLTAMEEHGVVGEVIVADNGSTDGSRELANKMGVRLVDVPKKGYGAALQGGIEAAKGKFVIMGDADDSYDFLEAPKILDELRKGYDLVMGCRLPTGNGTIMPGAMPFLHKYLGNPLFSFMARFLFNCPTHDVYCGLRGFTKKHYESLDMVCTGMEFAIEMIIRSCLFGAKISEVPITLHVDGRQKQRPHLRTFVDGWRTLRLFMLYTPKWIFMIPGIILLLLGSLGVYSVFTDAQIMGHPVGTMTLLLSCMSVTLGYQSVLFALMINSYAAINGILPESPGVTQFFKVANLERGVILGVIVFLIGVIGCFSGLLGWAGSEYKMDDVQGAIQLLAPGTTMICLGIQTIFSSFFVSMLNLRHQSV